MVRRLRWFAAALAVAGSISTTGCGAVTPSATPPASASATAAASASPATSSPTADPTGAWTTVSSAEGRFSFRYPSFPITA